MTSIERVYIGIVDGVETWEIRDADGTVIGRDERLPDEPDA